MWFPSKNLGGIYEDTLVGNLRRIVFGIAQRQGNEN